MENSVIDFIIHLDSELHDEVMRDGEYQKASEEELKAYNKFKETLTDIQKEEFDNFINTFSEEISVGNEKYFKLGVKFGIRLAAECMF